MAYRIVFFGTPQFAVPSLQQFFNAPDFEVVAVVTQPDRRRGRGNDLIPSPVKQVAVAHNCPVWQPQRVKKDAETLEKLRHTQADAFVVVAYGQILSQEILDMPRLGCINGHGSILPDYRGAAPIQWCIVHGQSETGITTMLMDAGMDTGPMLLKGTVPIGLLDNAQDVAARLAEQAGDLLPQTVRGLADGSLTPEPQDNERATYAPLIKKADYGLDWTQSAIALHNQVRGFFPNCVAQFREEPLKVMATVPLGVVDDALPDDLRALSDAWAGLPTDAPPGTLVALLKGWGAIAQTGDGFLLLREVQRAGKKAQLGWDFVNGSRVEIGEVLGSPVFSD